MPHGPRLTWHRRPQMLELTVTDPLDLHLVTAEIHDWFYDLEDVQLAQADAS